MHQLRPSLTVSLSQRLVMTPSLLQKIQLLTLNQLQLSEMLQLELAENPVLEEVVGADSGSEAASAESEEVDFQSEEIDLEPFESDLFWEDYLPSDYSTRSNGKAEETPSFELFLAQRSSLNEHLIWQLNLARIPSDLYEIAYYLIGNINEDGYLTISIEDAAEALQVPLGRVEDALKIVQEFDPVGVGSRNLQECLLLQIWAKGLQNSLAEKLIQECLQEIEAKKFREISEQLGCTLDDISEAMGQIRNLQPRPGLKYTSGEPQYIQPDVYISKVGNEYQISANDDGLPKLRLSRVYRRLLRENPSKEVQRFIKQKIRSAMELLRNVDQRQKTIYRVCEAIIRRQRSFLDRGPIYLRPMLIKEVAEELSVHSSTISRVVGNKYAHTPQGVIELRRFFSTGVESSDGDNVSIVHVKERIKKMLANEDHNKPLSDQNICKFLNQHGIQITRRTVAKYRDQMGIAGSRKRKLEHLI